MCSLVILYNSESFWVNENFGVTCWAVYIIYTKFVTGPVYIVLFTGHICGPVNGPGYCGCAYESEISLFTPFQGGIVHLFNGTYIKAQGYFLKSTLSFTYDYFKGTIERR